MLSLYSEDLDVFSTAVILSIAFAFIPTSFTMAIIKVLLSLKIWFPTSNYSLQFMLINILLPLRKKVSVDKLDVTKQQPKKLNFATEDSLKEFKSEVNLFSKPQHPNVISLIRYCLHDDKRVYCV